MFREEGDKLTFKNLLVNVQIIVYLNTIICLCGRLDRRIRILSISFFFSEVFSLCRIKLEFFFFHFFICHQLLIDAISLHQQYSGFAPVSTHPKAPKFSIKFVRQPIFSQIHGRYQTRSFNNIFVPINAELEIRSCVTYSQLKERGFLRHSSCVNNIFLKIYYVQS